MATTLRKFGITAISIAWGGLLLPSHASAAFVRSPTALFTTWAKLDAGRTYREGFGGLEKTHGQVIASYKAPVEDYEPSTPGDLFSTAASEFRTALANPALQEEAKRGLQEALNELMAGQALLGNDALVKGLRVRFPNTGDPSDPDQLTLLTLSAQAFQAGIGAAVEDLRRDPAGLRAAGDGQNSQFAFFVENTVPPGGGSGPIVENEIYRFTNLVDRAAIANNSIGKRMFFFGNVSDVDNFPLGNFPGPEDLDLNENRKPDEGGRDDAARQLKRSGHATYLHTAVLQAVQTKRDFDNNEGYSLKRQVLDAERVFDDILAGFNPLQLQGDFVPFQPVENLLGLCRSSVDNAASAEQQADVASRTFDTDQTSLAQTLESQQASFLDRIEALAGIGSVTATYDLSIPEERTRLVADAHKNRDDLKTGAGQLHAQQLAIESARLEVRSAKEVLAQIPEKIRNEERKSGEINTVIFKTGDKIAALSFVEAIGHAVLGVSSTPSIVLAAIAGEAKARLQSLQQATLNGIESGARVKELLFQAVLLEIGLEQARNSLDRERAQLAELEADLERQIRNFLLSRANFASAYFSNPAYRLIADQRIEAADLSFESAMTNCYYATKALEYAWSERFNNPVLRVDGLLPESLSPIGDPFVRAESVFSAKFADNRSGGLQNFFLALREWDVKMRQLRFPSTQSSSAFISMRRDILNKPTNSEWQDFLDDSRVDGANAAKQDLLFDFTVEIATQKLFPDSPNVKIENIQANLVSEPAASIAAAGTTAAPANVELVMIDDAIVRTFFASPPTDDDLITYELQKGRTLSQSPFLASIDATIDGFSRPPASPNIQLEGHSPAATRWTLRMQMARGNNRFLDLDNLEDIELTVTYRFGKPPVIQF